MFGRQRLLEVSVAVVCGLSAFISQPSAAQENSVPAAEAGLFATVVQPFFHKHCVKCHDEREAEGEFRLDTLTADFETTRSAGAWVEILDRINLGEMPPEDELRPDATELTRVTGWITGELRRAKLAADSTGGRVVLRRLSRQEYANTVRDLLQVQFVEGEGPGDLLPPDGSIHGFDRLTKALLIDPSLMDAYFDVARRIATQAVRFRPPLVPEKAVRFDFRDTVGSAMEYILEGRSAYLDGDTMVIMAGGARTYAKMRHPFNGKEVPITGRYRVRIQAAASQGSRDEPVYMNVKQGPSSSIAQFRVDASPDSPQVYEFETTRDELFQGEYQIAIVNGTDFEPYVGSRGELHREATDLFERGKVLESTRIKARLRAQGDYDTNVRGAYSENVLQLDHLPKLYLDWIEVTGPLQEAYPPRSMRSLFFDGWEPEKLTLDYARKIFARWLPRAYRRRVTGPEVDEIVALVEAELNQGHDFQTAIQTGLVAVLCSPKFLYLYEPTGAQDSPRPLTDFEFASRLSYFLWSSQPDDELLRLATEGRLSDPAMITTQVDRMLADSRVEGFVQGFVRQWLKIDEFNRFPPDQRIFPQYYATEFAGLEGDLIEQPLAMIRELLTKDESIAALLESQWTMVNERLAAFYGIEGVAGAAFRRVVFADREAVDNSTEQPQQQIDRGDLSQSPATIRGGLLGMAGVHMWGSDGSRTKPVERGKYILDVLFNDPPPPPPPNAGEVEPNIQGEKLTVAERLARHREQTTCNHCHRGIDPYGLALENFNVIGQWRTRLDGEKPIQQWGEDRPRIDVSGTLPNGVQYANFVEFKRALATQQERLVRGLSEKLLMYALARTIEPSDRPMIDQMVASAGRQGLTLRSLLKEIATSEAFRQK